ncbi:hypothetical protein [Propionivibrio sp.]|uniref:hypothetical protein n=1 Tax=Propionivibrio sp. TaxID=2212460 RepID=UPI0025FED24E|nr:hypothetical protein [Propionivibrio sp.]MBK8746132.1 hypothetical protein [Propionivibrio sp.]
MSNSTITFDYISQSQANKEKTANAYFDAASPATLFGRRESTTSGLTWGYYGGTVLIDGSQTQIANGTLALTASATNYVEATRAGVVSANTSGFTAGRWPLYSIVAGASSVTSYSDYRLQANPVCGRLAKALSDANTTLAGNEARNNILEFTGVLTVQRNITVPLGAQQWTVFNNTSGGFDLIIIGATGTGVPIGMGKRAIIYADGTNVVRATADV